LAIPYQSSLQGTFMPEPWPEQEVLIQLRRRN